MLYIPRKHTKPNQEECRHDRIDVAEGKPGRIVIDHLFLRRNIPRRRQSNPGQVVKHTQQGTAETTFQRWATASLDAHRRYDLGNN